MIYKSIFLAFLCFLIFSKVDAQENTLLVSYDQKQKTLQVGDHVRLVYPRKLLKMTTNKTSEWVGLRGEIDSISKQQIWLKVDVKSKKEIILNVEDIKAIKKFSGGGMILTFVATYVVMGTAAYLATNSLNLSDAAPLFAGVFSIFPAAIITANIFYPAKPRMKDDFKLSVVTINH
ncbi:MAG: hypothetical protein IE931_02360 [Sphingobacteriales bacterium]|nr:hypothetical protein [Sphingobacteriales bacterium]